MPLPYTSWISYPKSTNPPRGIQKQCLRLKPQPSGIKNLIAKDINWTETISQKYCNIYPSPQDVAKAPSILQLCKDKKIDAVPSENSILYNLERKSEYQFGNLVTPSLKVQYEKYACLKPDNEMPENEMSENEMPENGKPENEMPENESVPHMSYM